MHINVCLSSKLCKHCRNIFFQTSVSQFLFKWLFKDSVSHDTDHTLIINSIQALYIFWCVQFYCPSSTRQISSPELSVVSETFLKMAYIQRPPLFCCALWDCPPSSRLLQSCFSCEENEPHSMKDMTVKQSALVDLKKFHHLWWGQISGHTHTQPHKTVGRERWCLIRTNAIYPNKRGKE